MRIVSASDSWALGWLTWRENPSCWTGTFVVKRVWKLSPDGGPLQPLDAELSGDAGDEGNPHPGSRYPSDLVPFKPKADLLLVGTCHRPEGKPGMECEVSLGVDRFAKRLKVWGDRLWIASVIGERISTVAPFARIPLRWEGSFGGEGHAPNPVGKGIGGNSLPNIEDPEHPIRSPEDRPSPAGFAPVPMTWPQRMRKAGSYDSKWLRDRWPFYPTDFDWSYFNAAPEDQQLPHYLRGDEELVFENLHPSHRVYRSRLPGVRMRFFLQDTAQGQTRFREVPLNLDTLWVDMDEEKAVLVWRGKADVPSFRMREIQGILVAEEPLTTIPKTLEGYREEFVKSLATPEEVPVAESPEPTEPAIDEQVEALENEAEALLEDVESKAESEASAALEQAKSELPAGLDPGLLEVRYAPYDPKVLRAQIDQAVEEARRLQPDLEPELKELQEIELPEATLPKEEEEGEPEAPPPAPAWNRESVLAAVARGFDFAEQDLSGLDLSGTDLRSGKLAGARLSRTDLSGANLEDADLRGTVLEESVLSGTNLARALLDDADFTRAVLSGACLSGASLRGSVVEEAVLTGANLDEAKGFGCSFERSRLENASFRRAQFPSANFEKSALAGANFAGAKLSAAQFEEARAAGIVMEGADLTGLHASDGADFSGGDFRGVQGAKSTWEESKLDRANFARAELDRADFTGASLRGAVFAEARLDHAVFEEASLEGADLRKAWLAHGSFERADLTRADLREANLYEVEFWDARKEGTLLEGAFVEGTKLCSP